MQDETKITLKEAKKLEKALKQVLRQYRTMTATIKRRLNALGFQLRITRKHIKIYYQNDKSHWALIAKTASDVKAGINVSRQIFRELIAPQIS